jgi:hypothetical protein
MLNKDGTGPRKKGVGKRQARLLSIENGCRKKERSNTTYALDKPKKESLIEFVIKTLSFFATLLPTAVRLYKGIHQICENDKRTLIESSNEKKYDKKL